MSSCKTCIHWREVLTGSATSKPIRIDDVSVKCCTALPPLGDYRWPRTMEHQVCGMHPDFQKPEARCQTEIKTMEMSPELLEFLKQNFVANPAPSPVPSQVSDLLNQVEPPAAPVKAPRKTRGSA